MGDITDLNPVLQLLELKNTDEEKYKATLKGIEDVTRDLIKISIVLGDEQRELQQVKLKEQMKKQQEEAHKNAKEKVAKADAKIEKPVEESK